MKLDRIGDFVLALGAIRLVLARHGESTCALVISPEVADLAEREFPGVAIFRLPAFSRHKRAWCDWLRARRILSAVSCDELFCFRHQRWDYHELILTWIRAGRRHVLDDPRANRWLVGRRSIAVPSAPLNPPVEKDPCLCREIQLHRELLGGAWGKMPAVHEIIPKLTSGPVSTPEGRYGVVAPLSSTPLKDLPVPTLRALKRVGNGVDRVWLIGSADQRPQLEALLVTLGASGWTTAGVHIPASLPVMVDLIRGATWVLTADSAAAHIAVALDRPTVVLLGGGCPNQFGPWCRSARQTWLENPLPCFDCGWRCTQKEPYCVTQIPADSVEIALHAMVNASA